MREPYNRPTLRSGARKVVRVTLMAIEAVIFDFHTTLVDQGDTARWLADAERRLGRDPDTQGARRMIPFLDTLWDRAHVLDPQARRDRSKADHRDLYGILMREAPYGDAELAAALYATVSDQWRAYDDAAPCLQALQQAGVRTVLLSNTGIDILDVVAREGLAPHLDAVVESFKIGAVKPEAAAFEYAMATVGAKPETTLMVGDNLTADGGGAALGIRTLILPRTRGRSHGLAVVNGLVEASRP